MMKKRSAFLVAIVLAVLMMMSSTIVYTVEASTTEAYVEDLPIAAGVLNVVIKHEYSIIDKTFTTEDFPGVEITEIVNKYPGAYKLTLRITLAENTKQAVLDAIEILEQNEYVEEANAIEVIPVEPITPSAVMYTKEELDVSIWVKDEKLFDRESVTLEGTKLTEGEEFDNITKELDGEAVILEVMFMKDGEQILSEKEMDIHFYIPENINGKESKIYRIEEDNMLTEIESTFYYHLSDESFWQKRVAVTDSLGKFLIVGSEMKNPWELEYEIENGVITKYIGENIYVTIPSQFSEIGENAFAENTIIESVAIPESVNIIGENAFNNMQEDLLIKGKSLSYAEAYATEKGLIFKPTNEQLLGDVDGNRKLEAEDALEILKMVVKLETTYGYSADANADGEVTAEDALKVLRKVVALE